MTNYVTFELRRQSDSLVYVFDRRLRADGSYGYLRRDQDLWVTWRAHLGWVAYDEATGSIMGRPWDVQPEQQNPNHPPEGIWVSRKAEKSYVYSLHFVA